MGFFNWSAPIFGHFADRWDDADIERIAGWLRPYCPSGEQTCRLLDVGGGTGALARRLHGALEAEVTVLDPTPEMVRYIPADGPIEVVIGVAEKMPFSDDSFDAIVVSDAFHHFRDQPGAAREFHRVVRAGGGVVVLELNAQHPFMRIVAAIERLLGEPGAFFTPSEMCDFMASEGIRGECEPYNPISYRYSGRVHK